jgi:cytochrome c oxidase subunit 4
MENPALLAGIPLLLLGILGLAIALSLFAVPDAETTTGEVAHTAGHPLPSEYVVIGIVLAVITAIEVALFYVDANHSFLVVILIALSALKFGLVIGFFMHLKFDNKLFSVFFLGGLALAFSVFIVAVATLKAGLI